MRARYPASVVLLFTLLGVATIAGRAERLPIRTYTTADGLPSLGVHRIVADSRGFLWFCTSDGLSRFDGYAITTYTTRDGLPDRRVTDVRETRDGTLWVATVGGLCRFDPRGGARLFSVVQLGEAPDAKAVIALLETSDGRLWCGGPAGLFRLDAVDGAWTAARVDLGTELGPLALAEDSWGGLWVGCWMGEVRCVRPDGRVEAYRLPGTFGGDEILCVYGAGDSDVLLGTKLGLFRSGPRASADDPVAFTKVTAGAPEGWVAAFSRTRDGTLWAAATSGVWRATGPDATTFERSAAIASTCEREVWDVAEDRDSNLWLATTCGALRVDRRGFVSYGRADGLAALGIDSIFESRAGELVVTTNDNGRTVHRLDGDRFVATAPRVPANVDAQGWGWNQTVLQDREGAWWVPTGKGALRYPKADRPEAAMRGRPEWMMRGAEAFRMFEDSRGDVWIATYGTANSALARWERATGAVTDLSPAVASAGASGLLTAFVETRDGAVWAATGNGDLLRYVAGRLERLVLSEAEPIGTIRTFHIDDAGRLWFASSLGGLGRIDDPTAARPSIVRTTAADGLASDNVWSVTTDSYGRVYVGLPQGVDRLDPATGSVKHYTTADGLPQGNVQQAYRDRGGRVWFGTGFGLARLDPEPDERRPPPRTVVTGLRVAGVAQPVSALGAASLPELDLAPSENSVSVDFLGLGASLGEALTYQHMLEGADDDWTRPSAERSVTFANLAPGTYRLLVRAIDADGESSPEPAVVVFKIAAPLWQRWWFVLTAVALGGVGLSVAYRRRVACLLEIERVRTRIATDLHDDLGANLTRIAMLSEVASYRKGENGGDDSLASIARISRESVTSMSDIVWAINPKRDSFRDLVRRMRQLADEALATQGVAVRFLAPDADGDLKLGDDVRRQLWLVFKEAINNTARHSGCTRAEVEVALERGRIVLTVSDNGRGFDPSNESDGNGLSNMQKRARAMDSKLDLRSAPGEGTTVRVEVSLRRGSSVSAR